jgi:putative membrane protein
MVPSFARRVAGTTPYYNLIRKVAFPSTRAILTTMCFFTTLGVGICFVIAHWSPAPFALGLEWGIAYLAMPSLISNIILYFTVMKEDPLFYLRRCLAFSLFTISTCVFFLFLGSVTSLLTKNFEFPVSAILMGLFAIIPLRALAVFSMSKTGFTKRLMFTFIEPALSVGFGIKFLGFPVSKLAAGFFLSSLTGLTFAFALIAFVENYGRKRIGFSPIRMFRAFLTDWLEADNHHLETYLTELGVPTELDLVTFVFRKKNSHHVKGILLVSNFHPGPFLNIGSSVLPYLFQAVARRRLNAVALVPHGVSGHELNLVSQKENAKIIRCIFNSLDVEYGSRATPLVRFKNGIATATTQVFNGCALVTMTTAPSDMEDVPSSVANRILGLTQGKFRHIALIDAHNSLTGPAILDAEKIGALEQVALSSLEASVKNVEYSFKVGLAQRNPPFTLKEGFGPGGICVIAVEVAGECVAYASIDGNNMVQHLREEILTDMKELGFSDGEVLTSDTHMVNGIVSARLGYYPIGAAVPKSTLLGEIRLACKEAMADMEPCEVGTLVRRLDVTTLGSKSLKRVMSLVYKISKLTAIALFPMLIAIAVISLLFLV